MIRTREFCKKTVTEELRPGDVVQHFKRGMTNSDDHNAYLYKIICEAIHTETKEPMVVYQALYGDCATVQKKCSSKKSIPKNTRMPNRNTGLKNMRESLV